VSTKLNAERIQNDSTSGAVMASIDLATAGATARGVDVRPLMEEGGYMVVQTAHHHEVSRGLERYRASICGVAAGVL